MPIPTIYWDDGIVKLIDQTKLPDELVYIECRTKEDIWKAIKNMQIRGAPAIGIAAGFGVVLGVQSIKGTTYTQFKKELDKIISYLLSVRPTAVNISWALNRMRRVVEENKGRDIRFLKELLLKEAMKILEEDKQICRRMASFGAQFIRSGQNILTHCNAGGLATSGYGTALGILFYAKERGRMFHVYVDETRPVLQGARLTMWELIQAGIECTLICDNMAASLMSQGKIDLVIVGGDRIARNGDTANKIGTYGLACLAHIHKIPFYVVAPRSSFDLNIPDGNSIPIEERDPEEVTCIKGIRIAPMGANVYNPSFDITSARFITAFITEYGIIKPPFSKNIHQKLIEKG